MSPPETSVPLSSMDLNDSIIFEVRQRPALYDIINIPVQERTKLKKKDLWREISCCMKSKRGKVVFMHTHTHTHSTQYIIPRVF